MIQTCLLLLSKLAPGAGRSARPAVNDWIRTGGAFDPVVDLAARWVIRRTRPGCAPSTTAAPRVYPDDLGI
jgi:hypothetical protein